MEWKAGRSHSDELALEFMVYNLKNWDSTFS
jgi:hypothetical protein